MRGLLLKDYNCIRNQICWHLSMVAFFGVFAFIMESPLYMTFMCMLMSISLLFAIITVDENGGYEFSLSLPVSRKAIVLGKYMTLMICVPIVAVLSIVTGLIMAGITGHMEEGFAQAVVAIIAFYSIMISILMPIAIRWKAEKAKIVMMGLVLMPAIAAVIFGDEIDAFVENRVFVERMAHSISGILTGLVLVSVLALLISYQVSVRLFVKREF